MILKKLRYYHMLLLGLLLAVKTAFSQSPAETPAATQVTLGKVKAIEFNELPASTYSSEAIKWEEAVKLNKSDENAWLNLYKSKRYESYTEHSRKINKDKQKELDEIIIKMNESVPNSFGYHYAKYLNGAKSDESFNHLKAAFQINPNEPELFDDMLCDAVIRNNAQDIKTYAEKVSTTGLYNAAEVEYNRNVLNSIEQNGVLLTYGNVDTYPIIMMQQLQNFRKDVTVVCLEWLNNGVYKRQVAQLFNIPEKSVAYEKILATNTGRGVYVGLTLPPDMIRKNGGKLYCTGLTMKYSEVPLQNLESLAYNWEFLFAKNKINTNDQINKNYLLPLVLLKEYYTQNGKGEEASAVQQSALQIAERFSANNVIKKYID
jgi:hypothetical protein